MSFWNDATVEVLKQHWDDGLSASEISAKFEGQVTRDAVISKVHRLKLPDRTFWVGTQGTKHRRTYARTDFVRQISKQGQRGAAADHLAKKIQTKLREDDDGPKYPTIEVDAPPSKRVTIDDLVPNACRYIADPEPPFTYCAHDSIPGSSYCAPHHKLCHEKVSASEANRRAARAANWR